ncbi:carbohydrate ABC transporter permease [Vallitalea okinawensis]|uniref:carbohydrate ABC transporter permease n=1 Tax=Vallitalea okinawensis TaxID=2078660 RepID=UPI001300AE4F|nr:sugar ABC transporter permease [Vallitalea okinawensis]
MSSRKMNKLDKQEERLGWLFIMPFIMGFFIFNLLPLIYGVVISFLDFNSLGAMNNLEFVGLENYIKIFQDKIALSAYVKSFYFTIIYVTGIISSSLIMALLLNRKFYLRTLTRTMIYLPYVANVIAVAMIWSIILDPYDGPVNTLLGLAGVENLPMWLGGVKTALPTVALINVWLNLAFQTIVFLAALQEVPKELYESASIDGASAWNRFLNVTLPMISPTTFFLIITSIIGSFQNYAIISALTQGGPGIATRVIAKNMYDEAFVYSKFSYSSAQAMILFVIILFITIVQWKGQKKWVHY